MIIITYDDVNDVHETYKQTIAGYLKNSGWQYTCSTPGSFWLWQKEIDGKLYITSSETAIEIQANLDDL